MCHYITTAEGIHLTKGIPLIKSVRELSVDKTGETVTKSFTKFEIFVFLLINITLNAAVFTV